MKLVRALVEAVAEGGCGKAPGGGVELDQRFGVVYTVRDDKIAALQWFDDKDQALEAVGLAK